MKFSMNGFRRNLSNNVESLREIVSAIILDKDYEKEELAEAMNEIITASNVINCVYSEDDPNFTDMGNIEVNHLDI